MNYFAIPGFKNRTISNQRRIIEDDINPHKILLTVSKYYAEKGDVVAALAELRYPLSSIGLITAMKGKTRVREIVEARKCFCYLCKELNNLTLKYIGKMLGYRDHSTVIYAINTWQDLLDTEAKCRRDYENIKTILGV